MAINSRTKGKRGELEVVHFMKRFGFDAKRSQQYCGLQGDADVVGLPHIHIEVKRNERLNVQEAMEQSKRDAREGEMPTVMHRRNRTEWLVTMPLTEWMKLYQAYEKGKE